MKKQITFSFDLEREDDGRWLASAPDLPGVMCYGPTKQDALMAAMALALRVVVDKLEHGECYGVWRTGPNDEPS